MRTDALHSDMFAAWLNEALKFAQMKQAELARRLTERLRRGIDAAAVNKIIGGKRALSAEEMLATAEITGYPVLISLGGKLLEPESLRPGINEAQLVKLVSFALEWRGLPPDMARSLSGALLGAARKHPDRTDIDLTDDQLRRIARALADAYDLPPPQ